MTRARRVAAAAGAGVVVVMAPLPVSAYGLGGRQDLPVPFEFFIVGAGIVLVASFVALSLRWPAPRLQTPPTHRTLIGGIGARVIFAIGGLIGVVALLVVLTAGLVGAPNPLRNPAPVLVFVAFWLAIPVVSGLVGDIYPIFDPWRRLAAPFPSRPIERLRGRVDRGYLPAVIVFFGFVWLELIAPDAGPRNLAIAAGVYTIYLLAAAAAYGREVMSASFDGFAAYNHLLGAMGPLRISRDSIAWQGWLRGLSHVEERRGLVLLVIMMIGTVTYDGMSGGLWWEDTVTTWSRASLSEWFGFSRTFADVVTGTAAMTLVISLVGGAYLFACWMAVRIGESHRSTRAVASRFAHTLIPIAFAYVLVHYFTLIVFEGQLLLSTLSDPFGIGWDIFGTADRRVDYTLIDPNFTWYLQVAVIVIGHLGGVILAHDRALADFPAQTAVKSQYAMLGLMVVLTGLGLAILAAG